MHVKGGGGAGGGDVGGRVSSRGGGSHAGIGRPRGNVPGCAAAGRVCMCGGVCGSEPAPNVAEPAPPIIAFAERRALGGGAVAEIAGGVGLGGVALLDQVVALLAGRRGLE